MTATKAKDAGMTDEDALLDERARVLARRSAGAAAPASVVSLLLLRLGEERYALELSAVSGVTPARESVPLPGTGAAVEGLIVHAGRLVAVASLAALIGQPAPAPGGTIVLLRHASPIGLRVERAETRLLVEETRITRSDDAGFLAGTFEHGGRTVALIAPPSLISAILPPAPSGVPLP